MEIGQGDWQPSDSNQGDWDEHYEKVWDRHIDKIIP